MTVGKQNAKRIHGHQVMRMMIDAGCIFTDESLRAMIIDAFGEDTRFYTCSADAMTVDELIAFLCSRGKFMQKNSGFTTSPSHICEH